MTTYIHTWNLEIDGSPVVVQGVNDDNIMMDYPRHDDSIFTELRSDDMLDCWLFEGAEREAGDVQECAIVDWDGDKYITWAHMVPEDEKEDVVRTFSIKVISVEVKS